MMKSGKKLALALCVLCMSAAAAAMTACGTPVEGGKNSDSDSVSDTLHSGSTSTPDESTSTPDESSSEEHTHHYVGGVCECGEQEADFTGDAIGYRIAGGVYTGKMTNGRPDGAGALTYDDGRVLTAEFAGGAYSTGKMEYVSGDVYEGGFNTEGKYEGEGKYTFANGMYYEGEYANGLREGEGLFTWSTDGNLESAWLFEGTFKDDKASYGKTTTTKTEGLIWYEGYMTDLNAVDESKAGEGFYDYANGCTYIGEMHALGALDSAIFDGEGKFVWPKSDFVGTWENGTPLSGKKTFYAEPENETIVEVYEGEVNDAYMFHGNGRIVYQSGDSYEGGFAEGKYQGEGKYTFANGMYYEGEYANGLREGKGMFTWSTDGNLESAWLFKGDFKAGKAHYGKTTTTKPSGLIWYEGYMNDLNDIDATKRGKGYVDLPADQRTYTGELYSEGALVKYTYDGEGVYTYPDAKLEGIFEDGAPVSGTKSFYSDGTYTEFLRSYTGTFSNWQYHGTGKYLYSSGMYYEGEYVNGKREGKGMFTWSTDGNLEHGWLFRGDFKNDKAYYGKTTANREAGLIWYEGYMNDLNDVDATKRGKGYVYFSDSKCTYTGELYSSGALATAVYDGEGTFTWPKSDIVGIWSQGAPVSGRKTFYQEEENVTPTSYYEGTFKNWTYEGKGRFDYLNGCWYEGDFVNGKFQGEGTFSWNKELGKGTYLVGMFANGIAVSGTKYWPLRKSGLLQYTGKFSNTDNIDIAVSGAGKYLFANGDVYEGGLRATAANGTACMLTGTGTLTYAASAVTGAELGLEGEAAAYKAAMVYGEFTAGAVKGSAVWFLVNAEGTPAGYATGTYEGKVRTGAAAEDFTYTLPAEYDGTTDYTPAENAA